MSSPMSDDPTERMNARPPVIVPGRRRVWPGVLVGLVAAAVVMGACARAVHPPTTTSPTSAPRTTAAPAAPAAAAPAVAPPAPAGPLTTFGDGKWEIGVDIAEGKYKTPGKADGAWGACYMDTENEAGKIGQQEVSDGPVTIVIKKKDGYLKTSNCSDWTKVG